MPRFAFEGNIFFSCDKQFIKRIFKYCLSIFQKMQISWRIFGQTLLCHTLSSVDGLKDSLSGIFFGECLGHLTQRNQIDARSVFLRIQSVLCRKSFLFFFGIKVLT